MTQTTTAFSLTILSSVDALLPPSFKKRRKNKEAFLKLTQTTAKQNIKIIKTEDVHDIIS